MLSLRATYDGKQIHFLKCETLPEISHPRSVIVTFLEEVVSSDDDFEEICASAITGVEIRQHMYQRIDAWPWKKK